MAPGPMQYETFKRSPAVTEGDSDFSAEDDVSDENQLKVEINTFVWTHAPDAMSLGKADELACKILELFMAARSDPHGAVRT